MLLSLETTKLDGEHISAGNHMYIIYIYMTIYVHMAEGPLAFISRAKIKTVRRSDICLHRVLSYAEK